MKKYYQYIAEQPKVEAADLALIKRYAPKAKRILDIGCGRGTFLKRLEGSEGFRKASAVGIDIDPEAVSFCRKQGHAVFLGDGQKTKFKRGSFDIVRAKDVIEHLTNPSRLIAESKRLLKKGGILIIHTATQYSTVYPITNFWDDYTHVRPFTKKSVERLLSVEGFSILSISGYTAGRNFLEEILGRILGKVLPFEWRVVARYEA